MQNNNYNFEKRTLLMHFASAFNDVLINRFNGQRFFKERIKVPLVYAPKSHILSDIIGVTDTVRLPIMAVEITAEGRDNERVKNKIDGISYKNSDGNFISLDSIPWNISLEMTIIAKYQEDVDQIIQNFAVHTDPYIIVSWQEPKSKRMIRTEILWGGSVTLSYPSDKQTYKDPPFRVSASTTFIIKGYLFDTSVQESSPICRIDTDYVFTDTLLNDCNLLISNLNDVSTDSYSISGVPSLRYVSPYYVSEGETPVIRLQGTHLPHIHSVYISGSDPDMYPLSEYQPLSGQETFYGYSIPSFNSSDNMLSFTLPAPSAIGFIDVLAVNSCGVGSLIRSASTDSPYTSGII
jgi:hypothetical protein